MKYFVLTILLLIAFQLNSNAQEIPEYFFPIQTEMKSTVVVPFADELLRIDDVLPQLSLDGRKPLLLIHGWSFNGKPAPPTGGYWDYFRSYFLNNPNLYENFKPYYVRYWSNSVPIKDISEALRNQLEDAGLHEQKMVIIGHSMGGLVSRSFMIENSFTKGISKNKRCGENVDLLITLGTPHHGSPMANGPARNAKVNLLLHITMLAVEASLFKETKYNEVNRSNLLWDNYDDLLNLQKYPNEKNNWLVDLNMATQYDAKTICYSGAVSGEFLVPATDNIEEQYKLGSWFMEEGFNFQNDGIVPVKSAQFEGHTMKAIHHFSGYNHEDIIVEKSGSTNLFDNFKTDLIQVKPILLNWPSDPTIYLKHSTNQYIIWEAPNTVKNINLFFSADNGVSYTPIGTNIDASLKKYQWNLPDINSSECLIKIIDADFANEMAVSRNKFTIYNNKIEISSPSQYEYFVRDKPKTIEWKQQGLGKKIRISYFDSNNNVEKVLAEVSTKVGLNSYNWNPDKNLKPTNTGLIKLQLLDLLEDYGINENYIFSSSTFQLLGDPNFTLLSPEIKPADFNGKVGEQLEIGSIYPINWKAEGEIKYIEFFLCDKHKKEIQLLTTETNAPGFLVNKSTRIYVPEIYGNEFYFKARAGIAYNSIQIETYSNNTFRINRRLNIITPTIMDTTVSILPCFEVNPLPLATLYEFYLQDSTHIGKQPTWKYQSSSEKFCVPMNFENELQPGKTYLLTAMASWDSIVGFPTQLYFKTKKTAPWDFEITSPLEGDSTQEDDINLIWDRSVGASHYFVEVYQKDKLKFENDQFGFMDTLAIIPLNNVEYYADISLKVTSFNAFGKNSATTTIYKKFRTENPLIINEEKEFSLKNFPNPFNGETTFEFVIPPTIQKKSVSLNIYDLTGRKISQIFEGVLAPGVHRHLWAQTNNGQTLPKGIYVYQLSIEGIKVSKLMQIK